MIEKVHIENKKGLGWTIALGWIPFVNLFVAFPALMRAFGFPKLRNSPKFWITDETHFGNALVWSVPYILFTVIWLFPLFSKLSEPGDSSDDIFAFLVLFIPGLLISISLFLQYLKYINYTSAVDEVLNRLKKNAVNGSGALSRNALEKSLQYGKRTMNPEEISRMFDDLQRNSVIAYTSNPQKDSIEVKVIAPELQKYFVESQKTTSSGTPPSVASQTEWQCGYCGGKNAMKKNEGQKKVCGFCGAASS